MNIISVNCITIKNNKGISKNLPNPLLEEEIKMKLK